MIWEYVPLLITSALFAFVVTLPTLLPSSVRLTVPGKPRQLDMQIITAMEISKGHAMPGANTWIVKMNEEAVMAAQYGDPIQCVVAADTPEEARSLAAEMLEQRADQLQATPYNLGFDARGE